MGFIAHTAQRRFQPHAATPAPSTVQIWPTKKMQQRSASHGQQSRLFGAGAGAGGILAQGSRPGCEKGSYAHGWRGSARRCGPRDHCFATTVVPHCCPGHEGAPGLFHH